MTRGVATAWRGRIRFGVSTATEYERSARRAGTHQSACAVGRPDGARRRGAADAQIARNATPPPKKLSSAGACHGTVSRTPSGRLKLTSRQPICTPPAPQSPSSPRRSVIVDDAGAAAASAAASAAAAGGAGAGGGAAVDWCRRPCNRVTTFERVRLLRQSGRSVS